MQFQQKRSAFTLIELLVVLAILSVLIGLLVPAVQKVRESAQALRCQNNLKQIALATLNFHDANNAFPPARLAERPDQSGTTSDAGDYPTWLVRILPFLEQTPAYERWNLSAHFNEHPAEVRENVISTYLCPSRRGMDQAVSASTVGPVIRLPCGCVFPGRFIPGGACSDYGGNHGDLSPGSSGLPTDFYWGGNGTGIIISSRPMPGANGGRWLDRVHIGNISDGSSHTTLAGEMHVPRGKLAAVPDNGPAFDGSRFFNMSRVGGPGVPLATGPDDDVFGMGLYAFGSWHAGICQFAFADGRVSPVKTTISTVVLERINNRADGAVVTEY